MSEQLRHDTTQFISKQFPLVIVCNHVSSPANIGSIFRLADSFGIEAIYFCGTDITIGGKRMERTARSTHKYVSHFVSENIQEVLLHLQNEKYDLVALEITDDSVAIDTVNFSKLSKIALIIGEESAGVDQSILDQTTKNVHISMYGNNSSMNVASATGIAVYEITKQWNQN